MDALQLLIFASENHQQRNTDNSPLQENVNVIDAGDETEGDLSDNERRDSIMLLAEQASKITPVVKRDFNRPRANSEPWMTTSALQTIFPYSKINHHFNPFHHVANKRLYQPSMMHPMTSSNRPLPNDIYVYHLGDISDPMYPVNFSSSFTTNQKKAADDGRIGIYSREERKELIKKFREKQKRRIWKKSVRYSCRKNLADTRVRLKGRFVNPEHYMAVLAASGEGKQSTSEGIPTALSNESNTTNSSGCSSNDNLFSASVDSVFDTNHSLPNAVLNEHISNGLHNNPNSNHDPSIENNIIISESINSQAPNHSKNPSKKNMKVRNSKRSATQLLNFANKSS
mmetsp:Transcript_600/g.1032  ORF Transcript_600/g.1032 Transcript_600/m.1032 type:complete len:342 (-) Transcript_600:369-1394(-)